MKRTSCSYFIRHLELIAIRHSSLRLSNPSLVIVFYHQIHTYIHIQLITFNSIRLVHCTAAVNTSLPNAPLQPSPHPLFLPESRHAPFFHLHHPPGHGRGRRPRQRPAPSRRPRGAYHRKIRVAAGVRGDGRRHVAVPPLAGESVRRHLFVHNCESTPTLPLPPSPPSSFPTSRR